MTFVAILDVKFVGLEGGCPRMYAGDICPTLTQRDYKDPIQILEEDDEQGKCDP